MNEAFGPQPKSAWNDSFCPSARETVSGPTEPNRRYDREKEDRSSTLGGLSTTFGGRDVAEADLSRLVAVHVRPPAFVSASVWSLQRGHRFGHRDLILGGKCPVGSSRQERRVPEMKCGAWLWDGRGFSDVRPSQFRSFQIRREEPRRGRAMMTSPDSTCRAPKRHIATKQSLNSIKDSKNQESC